MSLTTGFKILIAIALLPSCLCLSYLLYKFLSASRVLANYTNHEFTSITGLIFRKSSKLPYDRLFFRKNLHENTGYINTHLPEFDMNDYDFYNVPISGCTFSRNTVLPKDTEFFQKIYRKNLSYCKLPYGDYSKYNFKGVYFTNVTFTRDSTLPNDPDFFRNLYNCCFVRFTPPDSFADTCHLYNLSITELSIPFNIVVSDMQKYLIAKKNNNEIYRFIKK